MARLSSQKALQASEKALQLVRVWGWRAALGVAIGLAIVAVYYLTAFLEIPSPLRSLGDSQGLLGSAEIFMWYAAAAVLLGVWLRLLSARLVLGTGISLAALVLNVAFTWTSGVFDRVLQLIPTWFPKQFVAEYLFTIQFPFFRETALDFYYLAWLGLLFALSIAFFRPGLAARLVRSLELAALVLIPLPVEVYLFDRQEFTIRVMDAQVHTPLVWFTNADMLGSLAVSLMVLAFLDNKLLRGQGRLKPRAVEAGSSSGPVTR